MEVYTNKHQDDKSLGSGLPIGSFYNVERQHLLLDCSGTGSPAVVFIPAAGMVGLDYLNIHNIISQRTTSVIYDRAGTGWSDRLSYLEVPSRSLMNCGLYCIPLEYQLPICSSATR